MKVAGLVRASSTAIPHATSPRAQITATDIGPNDLVQRRCFVSPRAWF